MSGHRVLISDRILDRLRRSKSGLSAGTLARFFNKQTRRMTEQLVSMERRRLIIRVGVSDDPLDIKGAPLWSIRPSAAENPKKRG